MTLLKHFLDFVEKKVIFYTQVFAQVAIQYLIPLSVMTGHVFCQVTDVMQQKTVQMAVMKGQKLVVSDV